MTVTLQEVVVSRQLLLVEDEKLARESLAEILRRSGYEVVGADSSSSAILEARKGEGGVVLMDIVLDEMDGIAAAWEIQQVQPLTSFIFVSAYADDPECQERARQSRIRVGGWLVKPILPKLPQLLALIEQESEKLRVLAWLDGLRDFGEDPVEYFKTIANSLPEALRDAVAGDLEAYDDLADAEMIRPLGDEEEEEPLMELATQINSVYAEIRALVATRADDPGLQEALSRLRRKLESLQEQEADAMERRFRKGLQFDPERGRQLLESAAALLRKK